VVGVIRVNHLPVLDPALSLRGLAELDLRRRTIEIERGGARLVDISAVDDDAVANERRLARIPG